MCNILSSNVPVAPAEFVELKNKLLEIIDKEQDIRRLFDLLGKKETGKIVWRRLDEILVMIHLIKESSCYRLSLRIGLTLEIKCGGSREKTYGKEVNRVNLWYILYANTFLLKQ